MELNFRALHSDDVLMRFSTMPFWVCERANDTCDINSSALSSLKSTVNLKKKQQRNIQSGADARMKNYTWTFAFENEIVKKCRVDIFLSTIVGKDKQSAFQQFFSVWLINYSFCSVRVWYRQIDRFFCALFFWLKTKFCADLLV